MNNPMVLSQSFELLAIVDVYKTFIWTERRLGYGDFELDVPTLYADQSLYAYGNYVSCKEFDSLMIIESVEIITNINEGSYIKVTGRSLESILDRRVIWGQQIFSQNFQNVIKLLLKFNIMGDSTNPRAIPNFIFEEISGYPELSEEIDIQFFGESLYDAIYDLCDAFGFGFSIRLNDDNEFVFKLTKGTNRSYNQDTNSYVVFSPKFDNFLKSSYLGSRQVYKNVAMVSGEGEGSEKFVEESFITETPESGLNRREMYVDASDLSQTYEDEIASEEAGESVQGRIDDDVYKAQLRQRGKEEINKNNPYDIFDGEVITNGMYSYGVDYFIGDIVQIVNEYGMSKPSRVSEMIYSYDDNGPVTTISFEGI